MSNDDKSPEVEVTNSEQETLGLLAYSSLAAMTRLAKDGDQAPNFDYQIDLMKLADQGYQRFVELGDLAESRGYSISEAAGQYSGMFDELDARTRPSSWWERVIKTYIVIGVFSDVLQELGSRHQIIDTDLIKWDLGQGKWVQDHLEQVTETDPQMVDRLSLWARRVAGEAFGLLRATLFTYPDLAVDPDTVDAVVQYATKRHSERMEAVGLRA